MVGPGGCESGYLNHEPRRVILSGNETQLSVTRWAIETFGEAGSNLRVAVRANEEMSELLRCLSIEDENPKAPEEIADIIIILCRLCSRFGVDLQDEVDRKMIINRARQWKKDGSGHGYHVREKGIKVNAISGQDQRGVT